MEDKLEIKPFIRKAGVKYKAIKITDITLHSNKNLGNSLAGDKIRKAFKFMSPGRIYNNSLPQNLGNGRKEYIIELLKLDKSFINYIHEEESKGYKILIALPNEGIPVLMGNDTKSFIQSKNGQRIIRGIDKNIEKL